MQLDVPTMLTNYEQLGRKAFNQYNCFCDGEPYRQFANANEFCCSEHDLVIRNKFHHHNYPAGTHYQHHHHHSQPLQQESSITTTPAQHLQLQQQQQHQQLQQQQQYQEQQHHQQLHQDQQQIPDNIEDEFARQDDIGQFVINKKFKKSFRGSDIENIPPPPLPPKSVVNQSTSALTTSGLHNLPYHPFSTSLGGHSSPKKQYDRHQHPQQQPFSLGQQLGQPYAATTHYNSCSSIPWKHRNCSNSSSRSSSRSGASNPPVRMDHSKHLLAISSILLLIGATSVAVPLALRVSAEASFDERFQIAQQLLESVPLIDGHNDLPWNLRKFLHNQLNDFNFDEDLRNVMPWARSHWSHTDLQRLKKGRVAAQFWAAYVPCDAQHRDAVQVTLEQIDVINRLTEKYSQQLRLCTSADDIVKAHKSNEVCSLIGVEGGHSLSGSLGVLRTFYALGVRYMTLTSTCHTPWADSSHADHPKYDVKHGGLTAYGKIIIREMNRLGMIVDLSHVSVGTMRDALNTSDAPLIFSHSSAFALCNSSRNVQDEILEMVAKNQGLVMVNFYSQFITCAENSSVHDVVAHINHIKQVAGIDHVGIGAGYDGINQVPKGLEDVSSYPTLFAELLGDGWAVEDLKKLAGLNFLRVMTRVEKIRDEKRLAGVRPFEDLLNFRNQEDPYNCTSS